MLNGLYCMPVMSCSSRPAARACAISSLGRMNFAYSCVPRGSRLSTYSAPTIASANDFRLRLIVEKNTAPPGFTSAAHAATTEAGEGTCSSISMQVTTSKAAGCSAASASADASRYSTCAPLSSACSCATRSGLPARSMPVTDAPRCAIASASTPPPQPTSRTRRPASGASRSIHSSRTGLMSCRGRIGPCVSHQRAARSANLRSSDGSAFVCMSSILTGAPAVAVWQPCLPLMGQSSRLRPVAVGYAVARIASCRADREKLRHGSSHAGQLSSASSSP